MPGIPSVVVKFANKSPLWRTLLASLIFGTVARAQTPPVATVESAPRQKVITDPAEIWNLTPEEKLTLQQVRFEGRVNYFDPEFKMLWLERDHVGAYVQLAPPLPSLKSGQYVVISGSAIPGKGLSSDGLKVEVLRDFEPIDPLPTSGVIGDYARLRNHVVKFEAFVDSQQSIDAGHLRLTLVVDDRPVICWVRPDNPEKLPNWEGMFVEVVGMYASRFDPTRTATAIEIWVARQSDVQVTGSLATTTRFSRAPLPIANLYLAPLESEVSIRGRVQMHEPGERMIVRDATGQVAISSVQQRRIPVGTEVEVLGRLTVNGPRWILENAIYRTVSSASDSAATATGAALTSVDRIRLLSPEEAAKGRPVAVSGVVTWSLPDYGFFFLQDVTGGIRVRLPKGHPAPPLAKFITVEGSSYDGGLTPGIDLRRLTDLDSMNAPPPKSLTIEQAMGGGEDGQWVSMRGFLQKVVSDNDWRWIYVTTPSGEFVAHLQSPVNFVANPGSLIQVHGVCETNLDSSGRIEGITLRVPYLHDISVEENAPANLYDLPQRSIKHLRQLSVAKNFERARVSGIVQHALPGKYVYIDDGEAGLLLLSHETTPVIPGDRIEAVGILGTEGARTVLRESVFRKVGSETEPRPQPLSDVSRVFLGLDSRLVQVQGTLIDRVESIDSTHLTLQTGATLFEAILDKNGGNRKHLDLEPGTGLSLTGIYRIAFNDSRQSTSFQIQLRDTEDLRVYQEPALWTLKRAMLAVGILAAITVLVLLWVSGLRRRVQEQTEQIRKQLQRQAELEAEVQKAARIESLGILAAGIAHDFNNLLTIVLGNLTLSMLDERVMALCGDYLKDVEKGALQARELTQQLLTFSKGGTPLRSNVSLQRIVRDNTDFILRGSNVRCEFTVDSDLWAASADRDQISQVVQNLVLNAVQAMPGGGILRVALHNDILGVGAKANLAPGNYVRLQITDQGSGIKPEVLPRIFDPYFTTKKGGTGLGLATVYSIIKKHLGFIEVTSQSGQGATFILWLPALPAPAKLTEEPMPPKPAPLQALPRAGGARVLLLDDEENIRKLGSALLGRMGLQATAVAEGGEAVGEFVRARDSGAPYQLVILDLTIPGGMGGREVIELIRKLDTKVPVIVSSGYSNDPVLADFRHYGFNAMVGKPYDVSQMAETVKRLLHDA